MFSRFWVACTLFTLLGAGCDLRSLTQSPDAAVRPAEDRDGSLERGPDADAGEAHAGDRAHGDLHPDSDLDPESDTDGGVASVRVVCGDGVREADEVCDDGNQRGEDGCSADCRVELGFVCETPGGACTALAPHSACSAATPIPADTFEATYDFDDAAAAEGECEDCDRLFWFSLTQAPGTISSIAVHGSATLRARLFEAECPAGPVLDGQNALLARHDDALWFETVRNSTSQSRRLYVLVARMANAYDPSFTLRVHTGGVGCGDASVAGSEECDDGNRFDGDGCNSACQIESRASICPSAGGPCDYEPCGDGIRQPGEGCEDGNRTANDGCSDCKRDPSYRCPVADRACELVTCGDGVADRFDEHFEECDDGNTTSGDGCSSTCAVESGFVCPTLTSCRPIVFGDGFRDGAELCDDGNTLAGDGCSATGEREGTCAFAQALPLGDSIQTFDLRGCSGCTAAKWFEVTLQPRQRLQLQVATDFPGRIEIRDGGVRCDQSPTWQASAVDFNAWSSRALETANNGLVPLPLRVQISSFEEGWSGFLLQTAVTEGPGACGDGARSGTEQCDDGNAHDADGCSVDCVVELGWVCEGEPSTCRVSAPGETCESPAPVGDYTLSLADLHPAADCQSRGTCDRRSRWFEVSVPRGQILRVWAESDQEFDGRITFEQREGATCRIPLQYELGRLDFGRADLAERAALGLAWSAMPSRTTPAAAFVRVLVEVSVSGDEIEPGQLDIRMELVPRAGCGDGYKYWSGGNGPGELCDDGNTSNGDGCSSRCTVEPGWTCGSGICKRPCGDGVLQGDESCDDANTESGDGCSSDCQTEPGFVCGPQAPFCRPALSGELCQSASLLTDAAIEVRQGLPDVGCAWEHCHPPDRWLTVPLPAGYTARVEVVSDAAIDVSFNTLFTITCHPTNFGMQSPVRLAPGERRTVATAVSSDRPSTAILQLALPEGITATAHVQLDLEFQPTGCGDAMIRALESCDDGNRRSGDGCSRDCQLEPGYACPAGAVCSVARPGDIPETAPAFTDGSYLFDGYDRGHCNWYDEDRFWSIEVAPGQLLKVTASADNDGGSLALIQDVHRCPVKALTGAALEPGEPISLHWYNDAPQPVTVLLGAFKSSWPLRSPWVIAATQFAPGCGDGYVDYVGAFGNAEGCDDGNTQSSDGCSSTCTPE